MHAFNPPTFQSLHCDSWLPCWEMITFISSYLVLSGVPGSLQKGEDKGHGVFGPGLRLWKVFFFFFKNKRFLHALCHTTGKEIISRAVQTKNVPLRELRDLLRRYSALCPHLLRARPMSFSNRRQLPGGICPRRWKWPRYRSSVALAWVVCWAIKIRITLLFYPRVGWSGRWWYCSWTKLTDHPDEPGNASLPTKIITTQQAPHNTFCFLIKADRWYWVLITAMYLNYFDLFFLVGLGWCGLEEVDNITAKIRGIRWSVNFVHAQYNNPSCRALH